jgi:hypothetical protein
VSPLTQWHSRSDPAGEVALDRRAERARRTVGALLVWAALIAVGGGLVELVRTPERNIRLNAPPLTGVFDWRPEPLTLVAVAVGLVVALGAPYAATRLGWRTLLLAATVAAAVWAVALALGEGWDLGILRPVELPKEYLASVPLVGSPGDFLTTFTDRIRDYGIHVQGHPPGLLLALVGLDRVGLGGSGWAAGLFIAGGALAVPATLVSVREVAGEGAARHALPFVVVAPAAIWIASTADALYAGVGAWAITLVVLATGRRGRRADALALVGGLLFGATAMLSYGLVLLALIPVVIAAHRRRLRPIVVAALAGSSVLLGFLVAGFWWFDGLLTTRERYFAGVGGRRPYLVFLIADLAILAVVLGPAIAVALGRLRDHAVWLLVGSAAAAVALADLTGMAKGEVERIWLPFTPWILVAGLALFTGTGPRARWRASGWLAVQVFAAVVTQTLVNSPW